MQGRKDLRQALDIPERHQNPYPHPGHSAPEKGDIEWIADISILPLQNAKWAVVGREFIEIKGYKRDDGYDRYDKSQSAHRGKYISSLIFPVKINARHRC